eukprot:6181390-Pleurochrysis_carterae.AAC.1
MLHACATQKAPRSVSYGLAWRSAVPLRKAGGSDDDSVRCDLIAASVPVLVPVLVPVPVFVPVLVPVPVFVPVFVSADASEAVAVFGPLAVVAARVATAAQAENQRCGRAMCTSPLALAEAPAPTLVEVPWYPDAADDDDANADADADADPADPADPVGPADFADLATALDNGDIGHDHHHQDYSPRHLGGGAFAAKTETRPLSANNQDRDGECVRTSPRPAAGLAAAAHPLARVAAVCVAAVREAA